MRLPWVAMLALLTFVGPAAAAAGAPAADNGALLPGGNSKEPISIEADKLVYSEQESRAIYSGNVVAIQGLTKLTCATMTLLLNKQTPATPAPVKPATPTPSPEASAASSGQVRHMECDGPVTIVSKTQTATGNHLSYDQPERKVYMTGNVSFSDGPNVTKGDKLTYDLASGHATVESGSAKGKTRVQSQLIPGSSSNTK